jgi:uncharacterized protein DUF3105
VAKRRPSGIQRRSRASEAALSRRISPSGVSGAFDLRTLIIGGVLVVGVIVLVVAFLFGGGGSARVGEQQVDEGTAHVQQGEFPSYRSVPATSGPHWNLGNGIAPLNWGVYAAPQAEPAALHNLEHGGIVIWYQPNLLDAAGVQALTDYVHQQVRTAKFKVILSPWASQDFGHPIAVTSWRWRLFLDSADIGQVRAFLDDHYGQSPESLGGPPQPG